MKLCVLFEKYAGFLFLVRLRSKKNNNNYLIILKI